jgi:hypothetical protein
MLDPFKEGGFCARSRGCLGSCRRADCEQGYGSGKTLVYDYVAEVRPPFLPEPRTFQRTVYPRGKDLAVRSL